MDFVTKSSRREYNMAILWIVLCIAVAVGAGNRGRNGLGWFVLSLLFSPVIAGALLLILGTAKD